MRLFRQTRRGDWSGVFERMGDALRDQAAALGFQAAALWNQAAAPAGRAILTPCSIGELIDSITILRLKAGRIAEESKLANVRRELAQLEALAEAEDLLGGALDPLVRALEAVNARLWDVEDAIRICERRGDFGPRFVELARAVYVSNDERAAIKRTINNLCGSDLVEEKSYAEAGLA